MKPHVLAALAVCSVTASQLIFAQQAPLDSARGVGVIRDINPVKFPAYDAYPGIARYAPTPAEYARAVGDRAFVMERITYRSDELDVYAYLYRPANPPAGSKLPVIIYNRGSDVRTDFSPEVLMPGNRLAHLGYLVIASMLRGSGGARGHDEMGGADLHDVLNIVDVVKEIRYADRSRLFLYGESRGGIMCLLAAKHNFPARAMAVWGGTGNRNPERYFLAIFTIKTKKFLPGSTMV